MLASACKSGEVRVWDPETGKQKGKTLVGHKQWITWLVWEPLHLNPQCRKLASSSKDGDVRIWDVMLGACLINLSGHTQGVMCIRWGGTGLIYSASQVTIQYLTHILLFLTDMRTIKIFQSIKEILRNYCSQKSEGTLQWS